jgi:hypothetical protein
LFISAIAWSALGTRSIQVESSGIRDKPSFLGERVAAVVYGDKVEVLRLAAEGTKAVSGGTWSMVVEAFEDTVGNVASTIRQRRYSREAEREPDGSTVAVLERVGYDPKAFVNLLREMAEHRDEFRKRTGASRHARIGINTGTVVVGNMGSRERFNYTILGDAANLAKDLEPLPATPLSRCVLNTENAC